MYRVSFQNDGLIDLRAITTFGANVKEHSNPIGFFGTGLKYALAVLMRLQHSVSIWRGLERYRITTRSVEIRGKPFDMICLEHPDGSQQELGFTTELGKTWEPWQCFRELYCNTLDERGLTTADVVEPAENKTTIDVVGQEFHTQYLQREHIVLEGEPHYQLATVHIFDRPSQHAYFRNVRIHQHEHAARFTYNLMGHLDITEDRTAKHSFQVAAHVRDAILATTDLELIRKVLTAPADSFETKIDFDCWTPPSEQFMDVVESIPFMELTNTTARSAYKKRRRKPLEPDAMPLNKIEQMILERAIDFAQYLGYAVEEYPIVITKELGETTWGLAYEDKIYINRSAFQSGTKIVAGTLIEEYIHLKMKLADESRSMQNHLINALISTGELARGCPL